MVAGFSRGASKTNQTSEVSTISSDLASRPQQYHVDLTSPW